ncbi:fatty acyl-CoA reductase 1-like [Babylonia areolata]|uniref:fatty acyl-CoA reductase 1-like n=1 Tax=Babylonia areolata TaxID=304850 RepID=UPI003FD298D9
MEQSERLQAGPAETDSTSKPPSHRTDQTKVKTVVGAEMTIPRFYAGKNVFVTGATGFMGKVLIEKLLRCCPDLGTVYCLMRPKKQQDIIQRFNKMTGNKIFDKLRSEQPDFEKKMVPVCGDMMEPELGISEGDASMLQNSIHIVFHCAATIRFDEPLRIAMEMNVRGVQKVVKLCHTFKHLEALIHVSTAFANCDQSYIDETIYQPTVDHQKILDVLEWMDDETVEVVTEKLLKNKPNTYTFSKHLAEWLLLKQGTGLPIAIVRPSIVGATWKDPFPGWVDNFNGPSGLTIAFGKGILRTMKGETSAVADIIPVDIPINVMIVVAWYTAVARPRQLMVYNSTTGTLNPFTWGEIEIAVVDSFLKTPLDACFRRPTKMVLTNNSYVHDCLVFVSHLTPAYLMDVALRLMGKRPMMMRIYNKLHKALDTLSFFTSNSWTWSNNNLDMLRHHLSPEDLKTFFIDPRPLHWPTYVENYCLGTKKYLLNEDLAGLPAARAHLRLLRNIRYIFNTLIAVALWRTLISRSEIARNLWSLIVKLVFKFVSFFRITSTM